VVIRHRQIVEELWVARSPASTHPEEGSWRSSKRVFARAKQLAQVAQVAQVAQ